ncbi:MAG: hypothetical protein K5895_08365 [Lachnospiraceae bacterium]|nr:hypothetical protein [Lachnospiraceae bacterium]
MTKELLVVEFDILKQSFADCYGAIGREENMEEEVKDKFINRLIECEKKLYFPIEEDVFATIKNEFEEIVKDLNNEL